MGSEDFNTRLTLLHKIKERDDENAWEDFCTYYDQFIKMVLRRLTISETDIQDISQVILMQLWKDLPNFDYDSGKGKFRTWLTRVIKNKAITYINKNSALKRKHDHYQEASPELKTTSDSGLDEIIEDEWKSFISGLAWKEISKSFSEQVLKVFELALDGKSNQQIAQLEDIKENTVAVYKKRVRAALHKEIIRLNEEYGG